MLTLRVKHGTPVFDFSDEASAAPTDANDSSSVA